MPPSRRRKQPTAEPDDAPVAREELKRVPVALDRADVTGAAPSKALAPAKKALAPIEKKTIAPTPASPAALPPANSKWRASQLPPQFQFPAVVAFSFALSSAGYAVLNAATGGELAAVGRSLDTWGDAAALAGWRIFELAFGWYQNYDSFDLAALNVLAHGPALWLLAGFYSISPTTAAASLAIDVLSALVPFHAFRPLSGAHAGESSVPNKDIITDVPIQVYTTLLSAAIYGVTVVSALRIVLPKYLVLYFEGIPSVQPAYEASYAALVPVALLLGYSARSFLFTPYAGLADKTPEDAQFDNFNPASATLKETFLYNVWGWTTKSKVLILRTAGLVAITSISTYLQCAMTIAGVASTGAIAYAGVWAVAGLLTGAALGAVGGI